MIVFFQKENSEFTTGQVIPFFQLPVKQEGEKVELNDFQWWAPTPKWEQWLKANPRDWKAESRISTFGGTTQEIYESLIDSEKIDPLVVSFSEFSSLMEDEGQEGEISEAEASKRYTKFVFAYNKLLKEGKIISNVSLEKLLPNVEYALMLDLQGENEQDLEQTRNAWKFKPLQSSSTSKFVIAEIDETILTGEIPEETSVTEVLIKTGKIVGQVALGGALALGGIALGLKVTSSILTRMGITKVLKLVLPGIKTSASVGKAASSLGKGAFYFTTRLGGAVPFVKGTVQALRAGNFGISQAIKYGAITANSSRAAAAVAKGSNPVGWIITAVMSGQQAYNWFSGNQAPRYGEIEDEGVEARDSFAPGTIPDGSEITVCWTQEAGQGGVLATLQNVLVSNDTRTTMNLLKIGNFEGKALFYLIDIHSEMYSKMLKENPTIFVSFDQNVKFEHGYLDNDDIEMELIIPDNAKNSGASAFFHGYCKWEEIEQAYNGSDEVMLVVPENAPKEYSFYFKSGKASREVNVTGTLIENLNDADQVKASFGATEDKTETPKNESNRFEIFSFSDFHAISPEQGNQVFEDESGEIEKAQSEAAKVYLTESQKVAAYEVTKIEFADPSLEGQDLPELATFIIPNDFLESEENTSIKVDPIQNVIIKDPKKGSILIESEESPEPIPIGIEGVTGPAEPEIEGGVPIEVTPDQIQIKYRDNPDALNSIGIPDVTKIKDKDKDDNIRLLDMITPEEKKELDMEDFDYIKKVKIYKDGKTGEPIMIKFRSGGISGSAGRKIKAEDANFDTALRVANRIQAGFKIKEKEDK